ncbi:hypothetical protein FIBSPDRAFT_952272 [Athelia psychrophila]|uniref:C2 domain-containing protein n=1 Tax=Athelia psychrophila TaxID=1759441 RepID=A0A166LQE1_9AGAM|nr:hypothetical protein FIBSPDRAFT_952272 [Fibularhizoctonia sp. CBS 109695]
MSSQSPPVAYTLQIISASDLPLRGFTIFGEPLRNVFVKATVEDVNVQTKICMSSSSPEWKETFQTEAREKSSVISLQLFDSAVHSTSLICASDIKISELLELCRYGKVAELNLHDIQSRPKGHIKIRFSLSRSGSWSVDEAQQLALALARRPSTAMAVTRGCIDAVDGLLAISFPTPPAMAAQSIQNVLDKLQNFMRIADAVAEVHPYARVAWNMLSTTRKIIVAQVAIDQSVADLFQTMQDVYSFVDAMEAVPSKVQNLEKTIQQILIQTAECGNFIREYSGHGFGGRRLRETMGASTPAKVAAMARSLTYLHNQFNTNVTVHVAVVCFRIQTDVATLVENQTLDRLGSCGVDLGGLPCCLPGTRCDVIDEILGWASNPSQGDDDNVLWLYGAAGTGKSAVAATVAHHFSEMGRLGAFVGFDRASPEQNEPSRAVKSLARQLAEYDGRLRTSITQTINDGPKASVLRASLSDKFDRLIVKPLASIPSLPGEGPIVVVLDGLYEYEQPDAWASLQNLLIGGTKSLPSNLRFIITSRTVDGILDAVTSTVLHPHIRSRELRSSSHTDIAAYFTFRMQQIQRKNKHLQDDWPGRAAIVDLSVRAFGFFAWAVSASNFLDAHSPPQRLQLLLVQPLTSTPELTAPLDKLYKAALKSAGDWTDADFVSDFRAIMGTILGWPIAISTTAIHHLLDRSISPLSPPVMVTVRRLGSVLSHGSVVQILHPSFLDFLLSRERCGLDIWYFEHGPVRPGLNAGPATICLQRMNAGLKHNMSNIRSLSAPLTADVLPEELAYACEFWVGHICTDDTFESRAMEKLVVVFLRTHLLHWFEAMSSLKKSEDIVPVLQRVATWLEENMFEDESLKDLVIEAIDLASKFAVDIAEHPLYVYYTALPLLPSHSILHQLFHDSLVNPSVLRVSPLHGRINSMAFSTDGLRFVTGYIDLAVWNTATGDKLLTIQNPAGCSVFSVVFSYDGSHLACGTSISTVHVWDPVSGAQVISPLRYLGSGKYVNAVAWSKDGTRLLSGCRTGEVILWNVMAIKGNRTITKIHHPSCSEYFTSLVSVALSPDGSQIASCSEQRDVYVWNSKTGDIMWSIQEPRGSDPWVSIAFLSSNMGAFLVAQTQGHAQAHNISTGDLCPLPDSLAGAIGLTRGKFKVHLIMESIAMHNPAGGERLLLPKWTAQGEYFAFAEEENQCYVVHLPKELL